MKRLEKKSNFILVIENEKVISSTNRQRFLNWNNLQSQINLKIQILNW